MMQKVLWLDTETTGLDPARNSIIQIAGIVEVDEEVVDRFSIFMQPFPGAEIEPEALAVSGTTMDKLGTYKRFALGMDRFMCKLGENVDRFSKTDKFILAGYNIGYDAGFLRQAFLQMDDNFFGSWFFTCNLDVMTYVAEDVKRGARYESHSLGPVCAANGVCLECAHDALADITATRELYYRMMLKLGI